MKKAISKLIVDILVLATASYIEATTGIVMVIFFVYCFINIFDSIKKIQSYNHKEDKK